MDIIVWPVLGHLRASTLKISHASGFFTRKAPARSRGGRRLPGAFTLPRVNELFRVVRFNYAAFRPDQVQ